jgi:4-hydroxythreonine-4-phosphate dehydrogenase
MSQPLEELIKVGITIGDPNGIGYEVIIKALEDSRMTHVCTPLIYGSSKSLSFHRKALEHQEFNYMTIKDASQAASKHVNLINCWEEDFNIELGQASSLAGKYALKSLQRACDDLANGKIDVLVTAPIDKHTIQSDSFNFPGHTEYLEKTFASGEALMLMVSDNMRIGVATGHIPVTKIATTLTPELILKKLRILNKSLLEDFGIRKPRIAVLGLNPHAGDNGVIGNEEKDIINPAIDKAKSENIFAFGPYAADGFFGSKNFRNFDGILAMYHDQGLVPFKALSFGNGVNFTAGLSIIRTSPDHGTGYDIAGKNLASEDSFRQAIYLAIDSFSKRKEHKKISSNPLKISNLRRE